MRVWSERSLKALEGVHPDLRKVCDLALQSSDVDFVIVEGCRSKEQQLVYFTSGKSKTMHSRHIGGRAIDFVALDEHSKASYDVRLMEKVASAFITSAGKLGVKITWGGHWRGFKDTPHIELDWKAYPDNMEV